MYQIQEIKATATRYCASALSYRYMQLKMD